MATPDTAWLMLACALAWARCAPVFLLTPALAFGVTPGALGLALSLGLSLALTPLYAASLPLAAAGWQGSALWLALSAELLRGAVIALGLSLPALVLRLSGAITEGLFGWDAAADSSRLGRLTGLAALVVAASVDGLSGALRLLLSAQSGAPAGLSIASVGAVLMPLSEQLLAAFALGVSFCGALLLGSVLGVLVTGILGRISTSARAQELGAALWPGLGLALLCLSAPRWLGQVPELVRGFAEGTARILSGLP